MGNSRSKLLTVRASSVVTRNCGVTSQRAPMAPCEPIERSRRAWVEPSVNGDHGPSILPTVPAWLVPGIRVMSGSWPQGSEPTKNWLSNACLIRVDMPSA